MDFWDTVLGHRLAETLVHTLPELTENPKQFMMKCDGNEVVNLSECDRITAIMVIGGKMYTSDCDHQDCYQEYCDEHGIDSGVDWDDNFDEAQAELIKVTNSLFEDEKEDAYGFDIFEGYDDQYYLTSHFPSNMKSCYDMMTCYAKEHDCKLGTFFDTSYNVKLIEMRDAF